MNNPEMQPIQPQQIPTITTRTNPLKKKYFLVMGIFILASIILILLKSNYFRSEKTNQATSSNQVSQGLADFTDVVLFSRFTKINSYSASPSELYFAKADGSQIVPFNSALAREYPYHLTPLFSPDRKAIVIRMAKGENEYYSHKFDTIIATIDGKTYRKVDGTQIHNMFGGKYDIYDVAWSTDSKYIVFSINDDLYVQSSKQYSGNESVEAFRKRKSPQITALVDVDTLKLEKLNERSDLTGNVFYYNPEKKVLLFSTHENLGMNVKRIDIDTNNGVILPQYFSHDGTGEYYSVLLPVGEARSGQRAIYSIYNPNTPIATVNLSPDEQKTLEYTPGETWSLHDSYFAVPLMAKNGTFVNSGGIIKIYTRDGKLVQSIKTKGVGTFSPDEKKMLLYDNLPFDKEKSTWQIFNINSGKLENEYSNKNIDQVYTIY